MTIKRRLFISNIIMLVMPIFLAMLMFWCTLFILMGTTGIADVRYYKEGHSFFNAMASVDHIAQEAESAGYQDLQKDIDTLSKFCKDFDITLTVYDGEMQVYSSSDDGEHTVPTETDYGLVVKDTNAVYRAHSGDYIFILSSTTFSPYVQEPFNDYFYFAIIIFLVEIVLVFIINRSLTRFITKRITTPIEVLVSGVHEISDGNLDYRIKYDYKDEFQTICNDFNDMAQRLFDMVNARQKDEENRKELIAGISHDLRTPLTSIKAYIEGIEKGVSSTPQVQQKYIDTIKNKAADMEHIINQLFMFSKLDIGEFPLRLETVDVAEVIGDFIEESASEYKDKGLSVSFPKKTNGLFTDIDVVQFRNVLHNIFENSVKYKTSDHVKSEIACVDAGGSILLSVADDGPGVPEESVDKLFDVFYRGDASRKDPSNGSGLGLAITKKIIEQSGGTIRAENSSAGGLKITITLPKSGGRL